MISSIGVEDDDTCTNNQHPLVSTPRKLVTCFSLTHSGLSESRNVEGSESSPTSCLSDNDDEYGMDFLACVKSINCIMFCQFLASFQPVLDLPCWSPHELCSILSSSQPEFRAENHSYLTQKQAKLFASRLIERLLFFLLNRTKPLLPRVWKNHLLKVIDKRLDSFITSPSNKELDDFENPLRECNDDFDALSLIAKLDILVNLIEWAVQESTELKSFVSERQELELRERKNAKKRKLDRSDNSYFMHSVSPEPVGFDSAKNRYWLFAFRPSIGFSQEFKELEIGFYRQSQRTNADEAFLSDEWEKVASSPSSLHEFFEELAGSANGSHESNLVSLLKTKIIPAIEEEKKRFLNIQRRNRHIGVDASNIIVSSSENENSESEGSDSDFQFKRKIRRLRKKERVYYGHFLDFESDNEDVSDYSLEEYEGDSDNADEAMESTIATSAIYSSSSSSSSSSDSS